MTSPTQIQAESAAQGAAYDAAYYQSHCGPVPYTRSEAQWPAFFGSIADHLVRSLRPAQVLDVGCALGFLVEALWDRGVQAWGRDISPYAIANVRPDIREYCRLCSAAEPIEDGPYDLITCIEVLEHMSDADGRSAIECMTAATDVILFSSSPSDFVEPTHVNVRPLIYWLQAFQEHGFSPDLLFDASFVAPHAMLLRRQAQSHPPEILRLYAGLLRVRCQVTETTNRFNESVRDLVTARGEIAGRAEAAQNIERALLAEKERSGAQIVALSAELETAASERQQMRAEAAGLRRNTAEQADRIAALEKELNAATRRTQEIQAISDRAREDLDVAAARIAAYIAERKRSEAPVRDLAQNNLVESRFRTVEAQLAGLNAAVNGILGSRIWRALVRVGGWVLKVVPQSRRK
jgi:methyltransferase family protein